MLFELDHDEWTSWGVVAGIYTLCVALHILLKTDGTDGYVWDKASNKPLQYRNNGLRVLVAVYILRYTLTTLKYWDDSFLYTHFHACLRASFSFGIVLSIAFYLRGRKALANGGVDRNPCTPTTSRRVVNDDSSEFDNRSFLEHFYCGIEFNPRPQSLFHIDIKMTLYLVGAVMLDAIIHSATTYHMLASADLGRPMSWAMTSYLCMFRWFVFEYLFYENVHTYTYDIFRERVGLKLIWGCLCFYPFFYCVGVWSVAAFVPKTPEDDLPPVVFALCLVLYFLGWILTRGANLQKHAFRIDPSQHTFSFPFLLGLLTVPQQTLHEHGPGSKILVSGWWGISRHINYLGEIIQAIALSLPGYLVTGSTIPLLYPLYYVALFIPRQLDDDRVCEGKYGKKVWGEYVQAVPYRIVPGIF